MVEAVRFARSTDQLVKGSKINFTKTIIFHWMWLEWASLQQHSHRGLAQGALSCIAVVQWLMHVLAPHLWNCRLRLWGCRAQRNISALLPRRVSSLLFISSYNFKWSSSSRTEVTTPCPSGAMSHVGDTSSVKPHNHLLALPGWVRTPSSFPSHILMQGLLTTPTVLKEYL